MVSFPTLICGTRLNESQWATGWHLSARTDSASYNLPSFSWKRMVALTQRLQRFIRITCPIWILTRVVSFSGKICASNVKHGYVNTSTEKYGMYRQTSYISRALLGNKLAHHSDVVGSSPVGAAPTISSFSTQHLASVDWAKTATRKDDKHLSFVIRCV